MHLNIALILFTFYSFVSYAQRTVGLLSYDHSKTSEGYTMLYPNDQGNIYLIDNCGEIVHSWEDPVQTPGFTAYLTEDGKLYRCNNSGTPKPYIIGGGGGESIERRDWDNNLEWKWSLYDSTQRLHHDIAILPNGNILAIAWDRKSTTEAIANGRDPSLITQNGLWPDKLIEIQPIGPDSAQIVWEWHVWDHLVQDYDSTKANYGSVAANPGKININYAEDMLPDWTHLNSVNYNPILDQIAVCSPLLNEIWIIDHSTTTSQAKTSSGGKSGKGGDLIYRWGNPEVYDRGIANDKKLFFVHDIQWIDDFVDPQNMDYGKLMLFNNRAGGFYSELNILQAKFDTASWSYNMQAGRYLPIDFDWTYRASPPNSFYSSGQAGCQRLWNGNSLVCEAQKGRIFEIDAQSNVVWEYEIPMIRGKAVAQGTSIPPFTNQIFRAQKYPATFKAFDGRDMSPKGYIQLDADTTYCDGLKPIDTSSTGIALSVQSTFRLYPNPTKNSVYIALNTSYSNSICIVYDLHGRRIHQSRMDDQFEKRIDLNCEPGIYMIELQTENTLIGRKRLIVIEN